MRIIFKLYLKSFIYKKILVTWKLNIKEGRKRSKFTSLLIHVPKFT